MKENKNNKKIIFLVIGVIALIVAILLMTSNKGVNKVYEVGKDIEAGEYVLVGKGKHNLLEANKEQYKKVYGYYAICTTKDCNVEKGEVETNDNVTGKAYVIVEEGQFLEVKSMKLYKVDKYKTKLKDSISYDYKLGGNDYYKVGKDLSVGTYTFTGDNFYYEVCSKPNCDLNSGIIANEYNDTKNGTSSVTVEEGQYLVVSGTKPFTASK